MILVAHIMPPGWTPEFSGPSAGTVKFVLCEVTIKELF